MYLIVVTAAHDTRFHCVVIEALLKLLASPVQA
jgi:hypothetical protein